MSSLFLYFFIDLLNVIETLNFMFPESRGIGLANSWFLDRAQPDFFSQSDSNLSCWISHWVPFCNWTWCFTSAALLSPRFLHESIWLMMSFPPDQGTLCFAWLALHSPPPCHYYTLIWYIRKHTNASLLSYRNLSSYPVVSSPSRCDLNR